MQTLEHLLLKKDFSFSFQCIFTGYRVLLDIYVLSVLIYVSGLLIVSWLSSFLLRSQLSVLLILF